MLMRDAVEILIQRHKKIQIRSEQQMLDVDVDVFLLPLVWADECAKSRTINHSGQRKTTANRHLTTTSSLEQWKKSISHENILYLHPLDMHPN